MKGDRDKDMKRILIAVVIVAALLLTGCSSSGGIPAVVIPTPISTPTPTETTNDTQITYVDDFGIPEILVGFGLSGSVVEFDGVYPGWSGTVPATIVNGMDRNRLFVLSLRSPSPSKLQDGYEALPQEYFDWITISEPRVTLLAGQVYQIPITLAMPYDSDYTNKRAEVRILIEDTTQSGLVQIALETKWFIITGK